MALHEALCKVLTAFEHGTRLRRTDNGNVACACVLPEIVVYSAHQWVFRTYHYHVDSVVCSKGFKLFELVYTYRNVLATSFCACVTRRNE